MDDVDCVAFLQWALPRRELRWQGFRKVRRQVCKRLQRRMRDLHLPDLVAYQAHLIANPEEWKVFDECCHITISRFFRDRGVFDALRRRVLPSIAARAAQEGRGVRIWSAGCASGEEPYTIKILWDFEMARSFPDVPISIVATDVDRNMLARARKGCYRAASLRELPSGLIAQAFDELGPFLCVRPQHREAITFLCQDLRIESPPGSFDLVLCRYVAFTYFALPLQQKVLARIMDHLLPRGYLAIGTHEQLPPEAGSVAPVAGAAQIFEKNGGASAGSPDQP